jgi:hypothetical protein
MVVPTDIQVSFITGALLADLGAPVIEAAARESRERLATLYGGYQLRALAYPAVFVGPAATVFMLGWPAWETQYWSGRFEATLGEPLHACLYGAFLALMFAGAWLGNWLGFRWVLGGARRRLRGLYLAVLAATVALFLANWPAPIRLGSHAAFVCDPSAMPYIWQDTTFFVSFWAVLAYTALPLAIWCLRIWRDRRMLRARPR